MTPEQRAIDTCERLITASKLHGPDLVTSAALGWIIETLVINGIEPAPTLQRALREFRAALNAGGSGTEECSPELLAWARGGSAVGVIEP